MCANDLPFFWHGVPYATTGIYTRQIAIGENVVEEILNFTVLDAALWYPDVDGDGYGNGNLPTGLCEVEGAYVSDGTDCNDTDASIHETVKYFRDSDGDGFGSGNPYTFCLPVLPEGFSIHGSDCDDQDPTRYPNAWKGCDNFHPELAPAAVSIFPNPGSGRFYLRRFNIKDDLNVHIYNVQGVSVWEGTLSFSSDKNPELDLKEQPPGIYMVACTAPGFVQNLRLVIQ